MEVNMKNEEAMSKLGTEKINKLMLTMGIPMILSMVLQAVYNFSPYLKSYCKRQGGLIYQR